jgi:hypothetical protein
MNTVKKRTRKVRRKYDFSKDSYNQLIDKLNDSQFKEYQLIINSILRKRAEEDVSFYKENMKKHRKDKVQKMKFKKYFV